MDRLGGLCGKRLRESLFYLCLAYNLLLDVAPCIDFCRCQRRIQDHSVTTVFYSDGAGLSILSRKQYDQLFRAAAGG